MREIVEREADGCSVSYGWHLSLNLLKAFVSQCQSGLQKFRGKDGCTMPTGASECVRRAGQNLNTVKLLRLFEVSGKTVCLTEGLRARLSRIVGLLVGTWIFALL